MFSLSKLGLGRNRQPQVFQQFSSETCALLLAGAIARLIRARLDTSLLRTAYVGDQPFVLRLTEGLVDQGLHSSADSFFETDRKDVFHPSQPLQRLEAEVGRLDLLVVGDRDQATEERLLRQVLDIANGTHCEVVPLRLLAESFVGSLNAFGPRPFRSCLNWMKLATLAAAISLAPHNGCIIEAGVYMGGTTVFMARLQRALGARRKIYALDTFGGMPEPTEQDFGGSFVYKGGMFADSRLELVKRYYAQEDVLELVTAIPGLVQDTLPGVIAKERSIALMLLDCDQYAGTKGGLDVSVPALARGGLIIVDDTTVMGVDRALTDTLHEWPGLVRCGVNHNFDALWHGRQSSQ